MIKTLLKKISQVFLVLSLCLFSQNTFAVGDKIVTFKAVDVLITNQLFVFKEAYGSLEDDFDDVFKEVHSFISQNGAKSSRKVIMYLDHGIKKDNFNEKGTINKNEPLMKQLNKIYGKSQLKSYRRVLVGYFVPPQYYVATREPFKEYAFKNIRVKVSQSMDKDVKTPISVLQENGETIKDDAIDANNIDSYTKPHRLYDKLSMLSYISLAEQQSDYVGMLEMYDTNLRVYTFIALKGNQEDFLNVSKLPLTLTKGKFKKRPDVEIEEEEESTNSPSAEEESTNSPSAEEESTDEKSNN